MKTKGTRENKLKEIDSKTLANYILAKIGPMNQLKMQKLLYYVQAYHLAYFDKPIIEDDFEAWVHGPVSRKIWNEFKGVSLLYDDFYFENEASGLEAITSVEATLSPEQVELINDVLSEYGGLSSYKLECLTHEETPWKTARKGVPAGEPSDNLISKDLMQHFYKELLYSKS